MGFIKSALEQLAIAAHPLDHDKQDNFFQELCDGKFDEYDFEAVIQATSLLKANGGIIGTCDGFRHRYQNMAQSRFKATKIIRLAHIARCEKCNRWHGSNP